MKHALRQLLTIHLHSISWLSYRLFSTLRRSAAYRHYEGEVDADGHVRYGKHVGSCELQELDEFHERKGLRPGPAVQDQYGQGPLGQLMHEPAMNRRTQEHKSDGEAARGGGGGRGRQSGTIRITKQETYCDLSEAILMVLSPLAVHLS